MPGTRRPLGRLARRPDLHLPSPPRRHLPRRHALRRARTCVDELAARARPEGPRRRAAGPSIPIHGAKEFADGKANVHLRPRRPERLHRRRHAQGAARDLPQAARDAGRRRSPRTTCPPTSASIRSAPDRGSSSSGSTTTTCSSRPTHDYWGGAPKADSLSARIIAEPSTAVAEFESGNVDVLQIPAGRDRATGRRTRAQEAAAHVDAGARAGVRRHQHHARPARRRARSPGDQLRDRRRPHHRTLDRRPRHARRRRRSRPRSPATTATRIGYPYDPAKAQQLLARGRPSQRHRHRALDLDDARSTCASPRRCRRYLNAVGHSHEDRAAREPPPRAPRRAKARRT